MIMCVLLCYPVSIRIYYQQGGLFLVYYLQQNNDINKCQISSKVLKLGKFFQICYSCSDKLSHSKVSDLLHIG